MAPGSAPVVRAGLLSRGATAGTTHSATSATAMKKPGPVTFLVRGAGRSAVMRLQACDRFRAVDWAAAAPAIRLAAIPEHRASAARSRVPVAPAPVKARASGERP